MQWRRVCKSTTESCVRKSQLTADMWAQRPGMLLPRSLAASRQWLEYYNRRLGGPARRIGIQIGIDFAPPVPKSGPFFAIGAAAGDLAFARGETDACFRLCLEIEPPGGFGFAPTVHCHGHEVRAILEVAHYHVSLAAAAPSRCR